MALGYLEMKLTRLGLEDVTVWLCPIKCFMQGAKLNSQDPDQTVHLHSLIWVFGVCQISFFVTILLYVIINKRVRFYCKDRTAYLMFDWYFRKSPFCSSVKRLMKQSLAILHS